MFKAELQRSEKHLAYKVKSNSFQQEVKAKCVKTKYTWSNEVLARIEYSRYLMSSNSVQLLSKIFIDSDFCHNYLHTLYLFERL